MNLRGSRKALIGSLVLLFLTVMRAGAQNVPTPSKAVLVLEKDTTQLDIIDPSSLKIVATVKVGPDPHEVIASADGKTAYVSNYMGQSGTHHMLSVIDLTAQKALPAIELGALEGPHGLAFVGGKLYFTVETNKMIGRYDPVTRRIDWVMGTGQDRTHMIWVNKTADKIITSNVNSGTISIIDQSGPQAGPVGAPPGFGGNQPNWEVTDVPAGRGSEGFDVSPNGKEIWTANAQDKTVTIIDFARKKALQTMPVPISGNRLKFTLDGKYVLISGSNGPPGASGTPPSGPNLVIVDAATRKEVKQLDLGGAAAGILIDPDGTRAFVASSGGNYVAVVDLKSLSVSGKIAPLAQPDGMAWAVRK